MRTAFVLATLAWLWAGVALAQEAPRTADSLAAVRAEIEALKPADHVWRAIPWQTCPLEALRTSREQSKPIIVWVFLGIPTDERC
jgi:hypothetical protein